MKPVNFAATPPVLFRRLAYSQTTVWAVVVMAILVCAVIAWLHFQQQQTFNRAMKALDTFRQARIDLLNGFLHLTLGDNPTLPFDREQGRVLLEQAIASFNSSAASFDQQGLSVSQFQDEAQAFRYRLHEWRAATATALDETELRIAFEQLETQAERLDEETRAHLQALLRQQETIFNWALSGAAMLLAGICGAVFLAGQARQSAEAERQQAEAALRQSEARYRLMTANTGDVIWLLSLATGKFTYVSPSVQKLRGYTPEEVLDQTMADALTPASLTLVAEAMPGRLERFYAGDSTAQVNISEVEQPRKDGSLVPTEVVTTLLTDAQGQVTEILGVTRDITERKQAEEKLRESEEWLRLAYDAAELGIWRNDIAANTYSFDARAREHYGLEVAEIAAAEIARRIHPDDLERLQQEIAATIDPASSGRFATEYRVVHPGGAVHWLAVHARVVFEGEGEARRPVMGYGTSQDITARKQVERKLQASTERFNTFFFNIPLQGVIYQFIRDGQGEIIDWEISDINPLGAASLDQPADALIGQRASALFGCEVFSPYLELSRQVAATREARLFETHFETNGRDYLSSIFMVGTNHYANVSVDITERKQAEEDLRQTMLELTRSNAELEQFAYIASHDLQEPLRGIAGTVQLLQRRYGGQLDERADEFIRHAVEGATRMQTLINDLLVFSRVGTRGQPFQPVELADVLADVTANLTVAIHESEAAISYNNLPTVVADRTQLIQLFQNLIANAIKFRGERVPDIRIRAERQKGEWLFAVADNGIGLEAEYYERIFGVFQRLHTRREYPGTGIGLALCKKIIERHGGRIWVESEPGQGATFYFTLPERRTVISSQKSD